MQLGKLGIVKLLKLMAGNYICFFVTSLNSGGIENYLLRFLKFSEGRYNPIVVCKSGRFGELEDKFKKIKDIRLISIKPGYFNIFSFLRIYRFLKKYKVNAICDFTGNFAGIIILIAKLAKVKTRISFYRGAAIRFKQTAFKMAYNRIVHFLVFKYSTKILSNSEAALDLFYPTRDLNDNKFKVIYNGIDVENFKIDEDQIVVRKLLNLPLNSFIVGHVGRVDFSKNHQLIVEVAKNIIKKDEDIIFVLCGKNTEIFRDKVLSNNPEFRDRFFALGYREDVNLVLKALDLFIFPSLIEGQPNALIEAMVSGLPIIASNIKPIIETTPSDIHEYLKDANDVDGFVDLIQNCFISPSMRMKLRKKEWATKRFAPSIWFKHFSDELGIY